MKTQLQYSAVVLASALLVACGDSGDGAGGDGFDDSAGDGSGADEGGDEGGGAIPGVGQGGAQDFGQFKAILEAGGIPGPDTIDDVGFFAEHKIDFAAPECGSDVCVHGELGVMGNMIDGTNCTVIAVGMNTPIDPSELERPPLNLAIAIDTSASMLGTPLGFVKSGLRRMTDVLEPEDRITIIAFSDDATTVAEDLPGDSPALAAAIEGLNAQGQTNVYAGLRTAYEAVDSHAEGRRQNRVILLSDGEANTGLHEDARIEAMSGLYNDSGYGLTTIGVGSGFNPDLMRNLAERGSGAFYFLESVGAVEEVFVEEVEAFLVPLAQEVTISLDVQPGYELRGIFGTKLFALGADDAEIEIPLLQVAHRTSDGDQETGRRGGGGAIVAELVGDPSAPTPPEGAVGTLEMTYRIPNTQQTVTQVIDVTSPHAPGDSPDGGHFTNDGALKSFITLNIYAAFEMASTRATVGNRTGALSILLAIEPAVRAWVQQNPDADIEDDLRYVDLFIANLRAHGAEDPPPQQTPPEPWPRD